MLIFILFVSAGFLFDGAFSLWVSLTVALQFSNRSLLKRGLKRGLTPSLYGCYRHWASPITYVLIVTYLPWLQAYTLLKMKAWKSFFTKFWTKFRINSDINLYKNEYMMHKVYYFKSPSKNKILKLRKKALRLYKNIFFRVHSFWWGEKVIFCWTEYLRSLARITFYNELWQHSCLNVLF